MASYDYGRPSTDDYDENRPLIDESDRDPQDVAQHRSFRQRLSHNMVAIFGPLSKPQDLRPLERFLIGLAIVLLLLSSVFIGLFAGSQNRLSHRPSVPWTPGHGNPDPQPPSGDVCNTKECVLAAGSILKGLDDTADPCHNFYDFANGGWIQSHPIPADDAAYATANEIAIETAKIFKDILANVPSGSYDNDNDNDDDDDDDKERQAKADRQNLIKIKSFYDSCLDVKAQDKLDAKPLMDVIHELLNLLNVPANVYESHEILDEVIQPGQGISLTEKMVHQATTTPLPPNKPPSRAPKTHNPSETPKPTPPSGRRQRGLTEALAWAHSRNLPVFFEWAMAGDPFQNPKAAVPHLYPSGLGLPNRAYYDNDEKLAFYAQLVEDGLQLVDNQEANDGKKDKSKAARNNSNPISYTKLAPQVVEFERQIAKITPDIVELYDPVLSYHLHNVTSLPYIFQSIDWPSYLSALSVREPRQVILLSDNFVRSLDSLISRTRTNVIEAYLVWSAVRVFGGWLGPKVELGKPAVQLDRFIRGIDSDAKQDRERVCLRDLNENLGFLTGRYYVERAFSAASKSRVETIIHSVIGAFVSRLPELDWLDEKTRQKAAEKAHAIRVMAGYPVSPNTTDAVSVKRYYDDLTVRKTDYFGNKLRNRIRISRREWAFTNRNLDPELWEMYPSLVNAQYSPEGNYILFPAGITQPPFFSVSWPAYLQYGAFGAVAGHELSHAFDPTGRLYDEDGYLHDWWSEQTAHEFAGREACLVAQYGSYTVADGRGGEIHLHSNFTKGEDVADAGGVAQAFHAWKDEAARQQSRSNHAAQGRGSPLDQQLLPGLGYTPEQLFFIAYAQSWARNIRVEEVVRLIYVDPHSPPNYRVNGVLVNNPEFAAAFGCRPGKDAMAKSVDKRCLIW